MSEKPLLFLIRHGETDSNRVGRFAGWNDDRLNETGRAQATALAARLRYLVVDSIFTSPVRRAVETAEILGEALGAPIRTVHDLHELEVGRWKGWTEAEVRERWPEEHHDWKRRPETFRVEGREALAALSARSLRALDQIGRVRLSGPESPAAVITHLAVLRVLRLHAEARPLSAYHENEAGHCDLYAVRWSGRGRLTPEEVPAAGLAESADG